jgi:hypothetical protein
MLSSARHASPCAGAFLAFRTVMGGDPGEIQLCFNAPINRGTLLDNSQVLEAELGSTELGEFGQIDIF